MENDFKKIGDTIFPGSETQVEKADQLMSTFLDVIKIDPENQDPQQVKRSSILSHLLSRHIQKNPSKTPEKIRHIMITKLTKHLVNNNLENLNY